VAGVILALLGVALLPGRAAADAHGSRPSPEAVKEAPRFPAHHVIATDNARLRKLLAGKHEPPGTDHAPSAGAAHARAQLADRVHLLMQPGESYDRVLVTDTHVALERRSGILDLMSLDQALTHVGRGQPLTKAKVELGSGPGGRPIWGEVGPEDSIRLYRQLPGRALGDVASWHAFTSFALSVDDAFHPYKWPSRIVTLSLPRTLVDRAASGELGGAGWTGNGGLALDVLEELQISSDALRLHLGALGARDPH
jgi:hypothetical protein